MKTEWKNAKELLEYLNATVKVLHTTYEKLFWLSAMGDKTVNDEKDRANKALTAFCGDAMVLDAVRTTKLNANSTDKERLEYWESFFSLRQTPPVVAALKQKITVFETKLEQRRSTRKEGYVDPSTMKFKKVSINTMRSLVVTSDDEAVRKACFVAIQELAKGNVSDYITLVQMRNQYANLLGFKDYYDYKLSVEEKMTKKELFDLWDAIYAKTSYAFADIRVLEKKEKPGLRKPWNFGYMMAGSFVKEEDPYMPFEDAVSRWAKSFAALGIDYKGGELVLDLLDREGKYNNGFCHWPQHVSFDGKRRIPGIAQFTCNVVLGVPGQGASGYNTLFHEGGHAAHLLNTEMKDVCVNSEYPPLSTAWAETQSMFLDTVFSSIEWKSRYAKNAQGELYPYELYERTARAVNVLRPLNIMSIMMVCSFERDIYSQKNLTEEKVLQIARKNFKKYNDRSEDSISILEIPHIYSADSSCSYQGYGLAQLALTQWRDYFYKKYGYIVDNPNIGKEMRQVWKYGGSKSFPEFVKLATGKKLSATAYIKNVTMPLKKQLALAQEKIEVLSKKPLYKKPVDLNATISLIHGKEVIATNKKSFDDMVDTYSLWLSSQKNS